ncbi:unnamed protein product [marine sediment metagenome]|uniref:Uncharacterized protein n=1 Tax=marine sediment metagenome TaxID=412755 RepID=X0VX64_9ZZZZ
MKYTPYLIGAIAGGILVYIFAYMAYAKQQKKHLLEMQTAAPTGVQTGIPNYQEAPEHTQVDTVGAGERKSY